MQAFLGLTQVLIPLLGLVRRSVYNQFAHIFVKAMTMGPDQVLDSLDQSSSTAVEAFRDLLILGNDLLRGKYDSKIC